MVIEDVNDQPYFLKYLHRMTRQEVCRQWSYLYHADTNFIVCITFIMVLHIFLFKIENELMVFHIPVKVALLNPLIVLIHIIKIFTIIHSMIFIFIS